MTTLLDLRVARRTEEAEGIAGFELVAADGGALPAFSAGAHIELHLPAGAGGWVRPYSLCNDPAETQRYQIAVLRDPASRGGSVAVHQGLQPGVRLQAGRPRNLFPLVEGAPRHRLLAGGIGITPLLAMAERLARLGADFRLQHATRSAARTPFRARLAAASWAARASQHLDDGDPAQRLDLTAAVAAPGAGEQLYVCGPAGFIDATLAAARGAGWPADALHCERFGAAAPAAAGEEGENGERGEMGFEVQLGRGGRVVPVAPGQTVVAALEAAGVPLLTSCGQGVCGTCLTRVLEGRCDHRDQYLTPEEQAANDQFLPCCSRARSARLVLDL